MRRRIVGLAFAAVMLAGCGTSAEYVVTPSQTPPSGQPTAVRCFSVRYGVYSQAGGNDRYQDMGTYCRTVPPTTVKP